MTDLQLTEAPPLEPDPRFAQWRADEPVRRVVLRGTPAWLVTRYEDVRTVLSDRRFSVARAHEPGVARLGTLELTQETLLGCDPPDHTRRRRILAKAFSGPRIERLRPHTEEMVDQLLDRLAERGSPVDLVEHFSAMLPIEIVCELIGVPTADRELFQRWTERVLSVSAYSDSDVRLAFEQANDYLTRMVTARRQEPADDLLGVLVSACDDEKLLTEHEMLMMCLNVLVVGHESVRHEITQSVLILLERHRDQWRRLAEASESVSDTVEELLRGLPLFSLGVTVARMVTEPVELGGRTLSPGELVLPAITSANYDETVFESPERLNFDRTENRHIAFGNGIHHCLGAQLARLELQVALRGLATRFPTLELAVAESDLEWTSGGVARGPRSLPVRS